MKQLRTQKRLVYLSIVLILVLCATAIRPAVVVTASDGTDTQAFLTAARSFAEQAEAAGNHRMTAEPVITINSKQIQDGKMEVTMGIEAMDVLNSGPRDAEPIIAGELQYLQDHGAALSATASFVNAGRFQRVLEAEAAPIEIATTLPSWNGMSLRDTAVQWAALCGEEHPTDIRFVETRFVETTRQKAAKLLDGARVDSDNACYAVVLHGNFVDTKAFTPDGRSMYGTTMTFIIRSTDGAMTDYGLNDLPYADLDTLGTVKAIAP